MGSKETPNLGDGRNMERYNKIQNSKEVISYEDFISKEFRGNETFGNFWLKFYSSDTWDEESAGYYQKFKVEHPDLWKYLKEKVDVIAADKTDNRSKLLLEIAPKLYEAYIIMIDHPEVKNNYELFG